MAVQKSKKTPSRRGMRRAHDRLKEPALSTDPTTGLSHRRHHIAEDGYYRGREIIKMPQKKPKEEEEQESR